MLRSKCCRQSAYYDYKTGICNRGWLGAMIGGSVLGAGMRLSGACPGTVWVQLGAQISNAPYTFAGCLAGALLFKLCTEWWRGIGGIPGPMAHVFMY